MTPTVSLCMPTFGRPRQLAVSLPALLEAVRAHSRGSEFEICVSDNASPDDTPDVIAQIVEQGDGLNIRCERQATNLGFAGNFAAVARMATGNAFIVLADDDALEPAALDLLLAASLLIKAETPVVLLDSLPGGDAVFRWISRPTESTTIHGPHELLQRLGIFHATFVSNLLFHRATALAKLMPAMLQSRYPHTALALTMIREAPATFLPGKLVRVSLPADTGDQPMLTSVDMARVMSEYALNDPRCHSDCRGVYSYLLKMLPTAIYLQRQGVARGCATNQHADLRLSNIHRCYRHSVLAQIAATILWLTARVMPTWLLGGLLRSVSRHPR